MKPTVYIETTIVSYLTAWPSRDIVRLSHEILTRRWWDGRDNFQLHTSELVILEASAGDPSAAADRLSAIKDIPLLAMTADAIALAQELAKALNLPERAKADALHIAVAAVHGISFLLTWNCRHLANAALTDRIERACLQTGLLAPRIVTPELLMGAP
jgi:hypothetical protein